MKPVLYTALLCCFVLGCSPKAETKNEVVYNNPSDSIGIHVFQIEGGYGYEIYLKDRKVIYQPNIPAIEGNAPFPNEKLARSTALLVSSKIRNGLIPPTLSIEEINELLKNHTE